MLSALHLHIYTYPKKIKYYNNSEISGSQDFHYDTSIKQGKVTEKERLAFISCSFEGHFWR